MFIDIEEANGSLIDRLEVQTEQAALKAFKTDRTAFVVAYLAHTLDGQPTPNRARQ